MRAPRPVVTTIDDRQPFSATVVVRVFHIVPEPGGEREFCTGRRPVFKKSCDCHKWDVGRVSALRKREGSSREQPLFPAYECKKEAREGSPSLGSHRSCTRFKFFGSFH